MKDHFGFRSRKCCRSTAQYFNIKRIYICCFCLVSNMLFITSYTFFFQLTFMVLVCLLLMAITTRYLNTFCDYSSY
ncbi:hypothetical protein B0T17DRAFT_529003 [Bombardia bombarda]|uniref:Uncharacterized protein n=1 Tax=Bombardia bombarda TaxID=252184 RepID=A0AA40C9Q6_9PEZI|nr:hypothetical protein B0T17DRAFT_529003 [Bombardia bombarda]